MRCKKCGSILQDESMFCMNCGTKVVKEEKDNIVICPKCYRENVKSSSFCSGCGKRFIKKSNIYRIIGCIIACLACIISVVVTINCQKSPIQGVSKKIYKQGQSILIQMDTEAVEKAVGEFWNTHEDVKINEITHNIKGIDFTIDLGKKPTVEEVYYAKLIDKFWESKAICYAHRGFLTRYDDDDSDAVRAVASMYKGIVSDFEDGVKEAKRVYDSAENLGDMERAYDILDNIWISDED